MGDSMFDRIFTLMRDIPQVEQVLSASFLQPYIERFSRPYVMQSVRTVFDDSRAKLKAGETVEGADVRQAIIDLLEAEKFKFSTRVINCTGIVIHTNLGRSPLGKKRADLLGERLAGYSNLEYDIAPGKRGKRGTHVTRLFELLSGAEASCVVNNNAAAVYLILDTFCKGRDCIVSRSELVQIGGGFRMPDVMKASGAILKEVGSTNRVAFDDYFRAVGPNSGLIAKIHWSNFKITGFTDSVDAKRLATLGREKGIPVMYDLGSGSWVRPTDFGIKDEPSISDAVSSGVDMVCFSGDKLLGGPQAGIVLGRAEFVGRLLKNPLYRAFRPDKVTLLLLEDTLLSYLNDSALDDIPAVALLSTPPETLRERAEKICRELAESKIKARVISTTALAGGGSAPEEGLPSYGVEIDSAQSPDDIARNLRWADVPVIGRIINDRFVLDLKAVSTEEDDELTAIIKSVLGQ
jgi:L-seryl-tRNA(Ser) seleniumtransferase